MKTGIIYSATNLINGKMYVGQTVRNLEERKKEHLRHIELGFKFSNALKKYKPEDWKWEILVENIPVEQLDLFEKSYIWGLSTFEFGYNSTFGGDVNPSKSLEVRKKISDTLKNISNRSLLNKQMSDRKKILFKDKINHPSFGKHHSKTTKSKMSDVKSVNYYKITKPTGEIEIVKNLNKYCKKNNLNQGNMYNVVRGGHKQCLGYRVEKYVKGKKNV